MSVSNINSLVLLWLELESPMAKKPRKSSRTAQLSRRKLEQKQRKLAADRDRLYALSPGGSPALPLAVSSPAIVESRAGAVPCPQCGGALVVDEHSASMQQEVLLRLVQAHCRDCHAPRSIWFRLQMQQAN
jgi:hypothetical protein